jgi:apolipoprotein D and lipocalin family protein
METSILAAVKPEVKEVDLKRYSGKWYVIAAITTPFDRHWNHITETYVLNDKGYIDVYTSFTRKNKEKIHRLKARAFPEKESYYKKWKMQFLRLVKRDYLIEELASDYSYAVVGHPKKTFLYILCRQKTMDGATLNEIINRCRQEGYDITKLRKVIQ